MSNPDSERTRAYYDAWGDQEASRLTTTPRDHINREVHARILAGTVEPGMDVLEIGAGTGVFTQQLLDHGANVLVTDLSPVQLDLNRQASADRPKKSRGKILGYELCDITDLSEHGDNSYDLVLAYGGPLSYAFEQEGHAVADMLRVTRTTVLASVMSLNGMWAWYMANRPEYIQEADPSVRTALFETGDMRVKPAASGHACRMFRAVEIEHLVDQAGGEVTFFASSNYTTMHPAAEEVFRQAADDPEELQRLVDEEYALCLQPGLVESGTHLIFGARPGS